MINAVSIEVVFHVLKSASPPGIPVKGHSLPIIGWESPILSLYGKVVGRSTSLSVKVEQVAVDPCCHTVGANADGDVAFEYDTQILCLVVNSLQLSVEQELYKLVISYFSIQFGSINGAFTLLFKRPFTEI